MEYNHGKWQLERSPVGAEGAFSDHKRRSQFSFLAHAARRHEARGMSRCVGEVTGVCVKPYYAVYLAPGFDNESISLPYVRSFTQHYLQSCTSNARSWDTGHGRWMRPTMRPTRDGGLGHTPRQTALTAPHVYPPVLVRFRWSPHTGSGSGTAHPLAWHSTRGTAGGRDRESETRGRARGPPLAALAERVLS